MLALCSHRSSLKGPFVTMFAASVHLSPNCSTAFLFTARNEWCATCCTNHGVGLFSVTSNVLSSTALTPTLAASASQSSFFGSQLLYSSAPTIGENW